MSTINKVLASTTPATIVGKDISAIEGVRTCRLRKAMTPQFSDEAYFIRLKEPTKVNPGTLVSKPGDIVVQFKVDKTKVRYVYDSGSFADLFEVVTPSTGAKTVPLREEKPTA